MTPPPGPCQGPAPAGARGRRVEGTGEDTALLLPRRATGAVTHEAAERGRLEARMSHSRGHRGAAESGRQTLELCLAKLPTGNAPAHAILQSKRQLQPRHPRVLLPPLPPSPQHPCAPMPAVLPSRWAGNEGEQPQAGPRPGGRGFVHPEGGRMRRMELLSQLCPSPRAAGQGQSWERFPVTLPSA